jgi:hypothetical protein
MKINHRYIIVGILFVAIIITGTTAYDSVAADRSVDISVVENAGSRKRVSSSGIHIYE